MFLLVVPKPAVFLPMSFAGSYRRQPPIVWHYLVDRPAGPVPAFPHLALFNFFHCKQIRMVNRRLHRLVNLARPVLLALPGFRSAGHYLPLIAV